MRYIAPFMILLCAFTAKAQTTKPPVSLLGTWLIMVTDLSKDSVGVQPVNGTTWRIHKYDSKTNMLSLTEMVLYPGTKRAVPVKRQVKAVFTDTTLTLELGDTWRNRVITLSLVNIGRDPELIYQSDKQAIIPGISIFAIMSRLDTDTSELKPFAPEGEIEFIIATPPPIKETKPE